MFRVRNLVLLATVVIAGHASPAWAADSKNKTAAKEQASASNVLTMVVMDPLAKPLSCPCVKGYAQRDYDKLAEQLEKRLGRKVKTVFSESLTGALKKDADLKPDLVIGKFSVVMFDAQKSKLKATPIAMLSGKEGTTTQTGLVVVPTADPAQSVDDLAGYRIVFGPPECDEKHTAAMALLKQHGVQIPLVPETSVACDDGACRILELGPDVRGCAVISSYAKPLLEGCGTIEKGALRVVGETEPVPFVGAFTTDSVSADVRQQIREALVKATAEPLLRLALETKHGFVGIDPPPVDSAKKK